MTFSNWNSFSITIIYKHIHYGDLMTIEAVGTLEYLKPINRLPGYFFIVYYLKKLISSSKNQILKAAFFLVLQTHIKIKQIPLQLSINII